MTSLEPAHRPGLAALADAILIPPFPGTTPPPWILPGARATGWPESRSSARTSSATRAALTAALRAAGGRSSRSSPSTRRAATSPGWPTPPAARTRATPPSARSTTSALTRDVYAAIGADLARLGINLNLAPCADVTRARRQPGGRHPVLRLRPGPGRPPRRGRRGRPAGGRRGRLRQALPRPRQHRERLAPGRCATVAGTIADLRARDLPPFAAAIAAGAVAIMPGHLRVPELTGDSRRRFARRAVTGLLRGELGFDGVVISDALEMKAASGVFGIPEAAVLAVHRRASTCSAWAGTPTRRCTRPSGRR